MIHFCIIRDGHPLSSAQRPVFSSMEVLQGDGLPGSKVPSLLGHHVQKDTAGEAVQLRGDTGGHDNILLHVGCLLLAPRFRHPMDQEPVLVGSRRVCRNTLLLPAQPERKVIPEAGSLKFDYAATNTHALTRHIFTKIGNKKLHYLRDFIRLSHSAQSYLG
jgi:hypothetical protein